MINLRQRAEKLLHDDRLTPEDYSPEEMQQLIHELRVHQVELELQNEELRKTQVELKVSQKQYIAFYTKYLDLYDVAPVGYCTLDAHGSIREINLTAAQQLGREREALLETRLYQYITEEDRDLFFVHLRYLFATRTRQACELRILSKDGTPFYASLESIVIQENENPVCRTTISDITERKRAEEELRHAKVTAEHARKEALEAQRFNLVAFGCTTCIGNSGLLPEVIDAAIQEDDLVAAAGSLLRLFSK